MPDNAPPEAAPPETAPHEITPHSTSVLHDRAAIVETCTRSAWSTDRRDWSAFREVFADEVDLDYTSLNGGEPLHLPRQSIVDGWRTVLSGLDATQHLVGNHLVTVDGDTAECTASVLATHILANDRGEPIWTVGGHYRYRLARTHEGWRISGLRLTVDWTSGNRDIMLLAVQNQPEHVREWKHENGRA
ncbi:nuclear transport factor 2 family protein [Streptomyces sp. NPDC006627]|uniref:nuclear transport factor 2 family protein n=1 Tax=Streptomyces sp. NPDC006627 TaxID=3154679 RepID=UPI0033ABCBBE